jgi:hypothetical protein
MTYAIATASQCSTSSTGYVVILHAAATDGVTHQEGDITVDIPFALNEKQAKKLIASAIANHVLSVWSMSIDADDVYFPEP